MLTKVLQRAARPSTMLGARVMAAPTMRPFALSPYRFEDQDYDKSAYQKSMDTHLTNAEELINDLPIVMVKGNVARCSGVNELGLGHPVQYIQLDRRHKHSPMTCKWCGLRYQKADDGH